jgi:hypothetical protein
MAGMPRFSLKQLLIATTCIACGIAVIAYMLKGVPYLNPDAATMLLVAGAWFLGGGLIGTGIGALLNRSWLGAAWGLAVQIVLFVVGSAIPINWP